LEIRFAAVAATARATIVITTAKSAVIEEL